MKLFLTRHGETIENLKGLIQSNIGGTLSVVGRYQANRLALRFREEKIESIFSSDLKRAVDTSKLLLKYQSQCNLVLTPKLREADFGEYAGCKKIGRDWRSIEGIESQESLQNRAREFYEKLLGEGKPDGSYLVVSHAGTMKALTSVLLGKHYNEIWDMKTPKNIALSLFEITSGNVEPIFLNNTDHLVGRNYER